MGTAEQGVISTVEQDADRQLKAKHRALWASGNYPAVAAEMIPALGPELVQACGVRAERSRPGRCRGLGQRGYSGRSVGGIVTASDLTPELFDAGRRIAANAGRAGMGGGRRRGAPFADNSFDVVMSCVGAMFAPHHQATADELVRVCRPGGTIGMINWTPQGFIGNLLRTMKPYAPPPPPGASPPPLWGDEAHVQKLFGERVTGLQMRRQSVVMDHCADPLGFGSIGSATTVRQSPSINSTRVGRTRSSSWIRTS